jgi:hypothetical protein
VYVNFDVVYCRSSWKNPNEKSCFFNTLWTDSNYNDYNANRQLDKLPRANESVKIAQSLGVTVEYLVTGVKPDKPDIAPVIQKLESALEEIRKLDS